MTITCPACQQQTPAAGKFCQECGSRLPPPVTGGNSGDIVATRSNVIAGSTVIGSDVIEALTAQVSCPICGRRNKPFDTFDCRKCGRDHICLSHQDSETFWCRDCIIEMGQAEVARIRATFRRHGADRITVVFGHNLEMDFCRVPAGEFLYGDNQERRRTDGFWIGKAPVTTAAFLAFVRETEYSAHAYYTSKVAPQQLDHPAKFVSWSDALAWCAWASTRAKAKVRLPAEVEWEKAARGTDGRTYPWGREEPTSRYGNLIELGANVKTIGEDAWNYTTPVGKFSPAGDSPYGLIDTCGNVWEWCADSYDVEQEYRVLRGGSFINRSEYVRCAFRLGFDPRFHLVFNGFRVVLNPPSF